MAGMNKKKERSQNAVSVKNRLFCAWGVLTRAQGAQIIASHDEMKLER